MLRQIIKEALSGDREQYIKYFNGLLDKYNVSSPSELSVKDKAKFFNDVDAGWVSKKELAKKKNK